MESVIEDAEDCEIVCHPLINVIQKMAIYTNRNRIYLVGADPSQTKFKVLKFERDDPYELIIHDDMVEYDKKGICDLLVRVNGGKTMNSKIKKLGTSELVKEFSTFGIFGVVRFLEGYYIIFITKRSRVAVIGQHSIYKIEETKSYYIPHESIRKVHTDEAKYLKLFNNVDLSSDFYFSYSYDLTNSLQYNNAPVYNPSKFPTDKNLKIHIMNPIDEVDVMPKTHKRVKHLGVKWEPNDKFMWNKYLLQPLMGRVDPCWILPVVHGFIAQDKIPSQIGNYNLTLLARRSNKYAGTRFLKRGANFEGDVANEVETEQIVHDADIKVMHKGRISSFVQMRGSVPCHWSQNTEKNKLPKPPINIDVSEPYAETAGKHFNQLLRRFGAPIVCVNLVKRREKKPRESILGSEFERMIKQLNHTMSPDHFLQLINFDMARINKEDTNVMQRLMDIAHKSIKKTGIYFSQPPLNAHHMCPDDNFAQLEKTSVFGDKKYGNWKKHRLLSNRGRLQTGIIRVNCVDCLDRTNTAQFVFGKCALAFQLYWLGELKSPSMNYDLRRLETMYEDHGDVLALQYGGSQLVHRIATYRKTAPLSSQGNDMKQSMTRYLANTFSDSEKQQSINLFLGVYVPLTLHHKTPLWELHSDQYLHQSYTTRLPCHRPSTCQWWDEEVFDLLPLSCDQSKKTYIVCKPITDLHDVSIDLFSDLHRQMDPKSVAEVDSHNVLERVKQDYNSMKRSTQEKTVQSTASSRSSSPGTEGTVTEEENQEPSSCSEIDPSTAEVVGGSAQRISFEQFFPDPAITYGRIVKPIDPKSLKLIKEYARIAKASSPGDGTTQFKDEVRFEPLGSYNGDSTYGIEEPTVPQESIEIYQKYVDSLRI